jgi:hypothetical protein
MEAALFKSQEVIEAPLDDSLEEVEVEDLDIDMSSEESTPADDLHEFVQESGPSKEVQARTAEGAVALPSQDAEDSTSPTPSSTQVDSPVSPADWQDAQRTRIEQMNELKQRLKPVLTCTKTTETQVGRTDAFRCSCYS